jgi:hypothetical protein
MWGGEGDYGYTRYSRWGKGGGDILVLPYSISNHAELTVGYHQSKTYIWYEYQAYGPDYPIVHTR